MDSRLHYKIRITGMVQGVGFRYTAAREAGRLGIKGYVKNMRDGSVCIEAEGEKAEMDEFVRWCRTGPRHGYVDEVEIDSLPPANFKEFRIEY